jgi:hypothetical protein
MRARWGGRERERDKREGMQEGQEEKDGRKERKRRQGRQEGKEEKEGRKDNNSAVIIDTI